MHPIALPIRVLIVEDEEDLRELIRDYLDMWGYETAGEAANGQEAMAFLGDSGTIIDLMITDESMPAKIRGSDLVAYCEEHRPTIRIIHMSTLFPPGAPPENTKRIQKPLHFPALKALIEDSFPPSGGEVALLST